MFLFAALLALVLGAPDEVDRRLAELGDPSVHVRHRAERWLTAHVDESHVDRFAPLIRSGDAEIRRRIGRIVAQADADLTMTARLMGAGDDLVASVGEQALKERINRWSPLMANRGETDLGLGDILSQLAGDYGPRALRVELDEPLGEVCALLERRGDLLLGITVEVEIRDRARRRPDEAVVVAGWDGLFTRVASAYGVGLDLFGFERTDDNTGVRGFLRFTPRNVAGRGPGRDTGEDVLVRWFRQSTNDAQPARRLAAARNLAASGWPDALAWMETRYRVRGDEVALEALLFAASGGRVSPLLFEEEVLGELLRAAGANSASSDPARRAHAHRVVDALGRLGCLGKRGQDLAPVILAGWEDALPHDRWVRLAILEAMGCPSAAGSASAVVRDPEAAPGLRVQALRTWVAATVSLPGTGLVSASPPGAEALVGSVTNTAEAAELAELLAQSGLEPPASWEKPTALPAGWGFEPRLVAFGWLAQGPAPERAGGLALDVLARAPGDARARGEAVAAVLRGWAERGDKARLVQVGQAARRAAGEGAIRLQVDRLALLADLIPPDDGMEVFKALRDRPLEGGTDLAVLAIAAGWGDTPEGDFARQRLTVLLQEALSRGRTPAEAADLTAAFETALGELQRRGMDAVALEWRRPTIQALIRRYRKTELARELRGDWPPYPVRKPVDPARKDRRLAPGAL